MIDRNKYLACNMKRIADDYSFARIESVLEGGSAQNRSGG